MKRFNDAFTLAEVLITLAIIGVVAAMTIPSLMQNSQNAETVAKVKKAYATLAVAFQKAEVDNGSVVDWGWIANDSSAGAKNVLTILAPYLNISNNCGTGTGCFPDATYIHLNNASWSNISTNTIWAKAQLADGSSFTIVPRSSNCGNSRGSTPALSNVCGSVLIDVNGFKGPNQNGKDLFSFYITKYGIIPVGTSAETTYPPSNCSKTESNNAGSACSAWILEKGNMDYLK